MAGVNSAALHKIPAAVHIPLVRWGLAPNDQGEKQMSIATETRTPAAQAADRSSASRPVPRRPARTASRVRLQPIVTDNRLFHAL
jgi:hypothetical protein